MPTIENPYRLYIGIDPGMTGGITTIRGHLVEIQPLKDMTEEDVASYLRICVPTVDDADWCCAIERIDPRPTRWFDKKTKQWMSSILKSSCLLYGSFKALYAILTTLGVKREVVDPKKWQVAVGLPKRPKGENDNKWKNRLKRRAQELYPGLHITLATADSVLLAHYCKETFGTKATSGG